MRCPNCGEPVTPYAAGCAICGADLSEVRARRGPRGPQLPRVGSDGIRVGIAFLLAAAAPFLGIAAAAFFAWQFDNEGNERLRNVMFGALALSVILLGTGFSLYALLA